MAAPTATSRTFDQMNKADLIAALRYILATSETAEEVQARAAGELGYPYTLDIRANGLTLQSSQMVEVTGWGHGGEVINV